MMLFRFMTGGAGFRFYGIGCCCCAGRTGVAPCSSQGRISGKGNYAGFREGSKRGIEGIAGSRRPPGDGVFTAAFVNLAEIGFKLQGIGK
jgi:hypothetical protein